MDTTTTVAAIIDPERQFLGCLLSLPLHEARRVLAGMRADDLADPACTEALQLVIEVAAHGTPPAPVAVYAHAIATGRVPGEHRRHRLSLWLAETYGAAELPTLAGHLKTVVLHDAWRRALAEHAARLAQAVDDSPPEVLADIAADTTEAEERWTRYQRAIDGATDGPARLGVAA